MSYSAMRRKRFTAGVLAGAMAMTVMPILGFTGTAGALEDPTGDGSVCEDAPTTTDFTDVTGADPSAGEIECLVGTGITTGTGDGTTFSPNAPVTRRQMALFLVRLADALEDNAVPGEITPLPAGDGDTDFTDIGDEAAAIQAAIDRLADSGIAAGVTTTMFVPNAPVTRRQMAKFIVRLQDFMAGEESTPDDPDDAFTDDEGDSGEAELNILAEEGIFLGDGQGNVNPGDDISRRQMANVIIRKAQYHFEEGDITRLFEEDDSNATLAVTPDDAATIEADGSIETTTPDDDRQYTASGLDNDTTYRVSLIDAENVTVESGQYTFADADTDDLADPGTLSARIVTVNGAAATAAQSIGGISPQSGSINFTVDSDDFESLIPVVYEDPGAGGDTLLDLDEDDQPVDAFGVGGRIDYVPAEAEDGLPTSGEVAQLGEDYAVLDTTAPAGGDTTVYFDPADVYRIANAAMTQCPTATATDFFENLSVGDEVITATQSGAVLLPDNYHQDGGTEFCLFDVAPAGPTALTASPGTPADTVIELDWTASATASVDSYNVYSNDEACADTTAAELAVAGSTDAATTEFEVTGLAPDTDHCFVVTAVDGADESATTVGTAAGGDDNTVEASTVPEIDQPIVTSSVLTTDEVTVGLADMGDVWTLEFDDDLLDSSDTGSTYEITDADGDTILVECKAPVGGDDITDATCVIDNGADPTIEDDTLTIELDEDASDRNVGGNGDIEYPLTITAITGLEDQDDGVPINVEDSTDLTID